MLKGTRSSHKICGTSRARTHAGQPFMYSESDALSTAPRFPILGMNYTNLIGVDSFVAIKPSSDAIYSYLACHISSGVYELEEDTRSQYGHTCLAGTKVLKGHFLNYRKTTREGHFYYTRKTLKQRLSFHRSVLYIMALTFSLVQKSQTFMYFKMWIMKTFF